MKMYLRRMYISKKIPNALDKNEREKARVSVWCH